MSSGVSSSHARLQRRRLLGLAGLILVVLVAFISWVNTAGTAGNQVCEGRSTAPVVFRAAVRNFCLTA